MKFAFYPGCSAQSTCKELSLATRQVAQKLGVDLFELESAACTGSRALRALDEKLFLTLNARTLAAAEQVANQLLTVCNTCTLNFLDCQKRLEEDPEMKDAINSELREFNLHYSGKLRVTHFLWMLLEDVGEERLKAAVVRKLSGLKLAAFYGCHIIRPPEHFAFFDSRNARSIERINTILGSESVDYTGRTECCGFHTAAEGEKIAIKLAGRHVKSAQDSGAKAIVTPCPLCHTVLDTLQPEMETDLKTTLKMPILHLPQLVGLALGIHPRDLGMDRHVVPTTDIAPVGAPDDSSGRESFLPCA